MREQTLENAIHLLQFTSHTIYRTYIYPLFCINMFKAIDACDWVSNSPANRNKCIPE